mmetsp:Transcript_5361/g.12417  ORF Transcript_5361/g.12417 Transcript_5361/m.12417 type:complete len:299 (-) Transcript_5361:100-996(-)
MVDGYKSRDHCHQVEQRLHMLGEADATNDVEREGRAQKVVWRVAEAHRDDLSCGQCANAEHVEAVPQSTPVPKASWPEDRKARDDLDEEEGSQHRQQAKPDTAWRNRHIIELASLRWRHEHPCLYQRQEDLHQNYQVHGSFPGKAAREQRQLHSVLKKLPHPLSPTRARHLRRRAHGNVHLRICQRMDDNLELLARDCAAMIRIKELKGPQTLLADVFVVPLAATAQRCSAVGREEGHPSLESDGCLLASCFGILGAEQLKSVVDGRCLVAVEFLQLGPKLVLVAIIDSSKQDVVQQV